MIERIAQPMPVPLSAAVRAGPFLFVSGTIAMDERGAVVGADIRDQTRLVIDRIIATLTRCGTDLSSVVKTTVWLSDLADMPAFNAEYARHFAGDLPARSTVQATLYGGALVEIEAVAWIADPKP